MGKHCKRKTSRLVLNINSPFRFKKWETSKLKKLKWMKLVQKVWIFRFQIPKARVHGRFENWKAVQKPMFEVVRGYLIKGNSDESLNVSLWEDGLDNEPIVGNIRIGLNCASPLSDEDLVEIQKLPSPNVFKWVKISLLILFYLNKIN